MESDSHYNSDRKILKLNEKNKRIGDIQQKLLEKPINQDLIAEIIELLPDIDPNNYDVYKLIKLIGQTKELLQKLKIIESIINIIPKIKCNIWQRYSSSIEQIAQIIENTQDNIDSDLYNQCIKNTISALNQIQNINEIRGYIISELYSINSIMRIINTKNKNNIDSDVYNKWIEKIISVLLYPKYDKCKKPYSITILDLLKLLMTDLMDNEKVKQENDKSIQENEKAIQKNEKVKQENDALIDGNDALIQGYVTLIQKSNALRQEYETLRQEDEISMEEYEILMEENEKVIQEYETLRQRYETLIQKSNALRQEYVTLIQKSNALRQESAILTQKKITLIKESATLTQKNVTLMG